MPLPRLIGTFAFQSAFVCACGMRMPRLDCTDTKANLGPVVQSLTSSLVVKMLIVLVSAISNSQVFLLKKM